MSSLQERLRLQQSFAYLFEKTHQIVHKSLFICLLVYLSKPFTNDSPSLLAYLNFIEALSFAIEAYNATTIEAIKNFNISSKTSTNEKSFTNEKPFIDEKPSIDEKLFEDDRNIIVFSIDASKKIETKYAYREYSHVKKKVALFRESSLDDACYDTSVDVIYANRI